MNLNKLRDKAYKNACEHGFHDKDLGDDCFLMLVITELSEAVEADRKGKRAKVDWFKKKIVTSRICQGLDLTISKERGYEVAYNETIKGSIEDKMTDAVIRLLDLAKLRGVDLSDIPIVNLSDIGKEFPIFIFDTIFLLYDAPLQMVICDTITNIFNYCKCKKIDLLWHIEQKMKYNELREYKYGKKY